jgi:hypothetical protein
VKVATSKGICSLRVDIDDVKQSVYDSMAIEVTESKKAKNTTSTC